MESTEVSIRETGSEDRIPQSLRVLDGSLTRRTSQIDIYNCSRPPKLGVTSSRYVSRKTSAVERSLLTWIGTKLSPGTGRAELRSDELSDRTTGQGRRRQRLQAGHDDRAGRIKVLNTAARSAVTCIYANTTALEGVWRRIFERASLAC